ncbi:Aste57867_10533 [Aphanomyces stellatus]|uniref:Aste57867_10533 protein n=1 Tax=Aphanomyces stellatus TaxID=120398 RepID=A0A485KQL4_9STRA|nr:hypothetical protein As57867_010493 [Aphanomyces stellatus]VFT87406.1 Aste57867_10533 [Aphanomyces stellatus]
MWNESLPAPAAATPPQFQIVPGQFSYDDASRKNTLFDHYTRVPSSWDAFRHQAIFDDRSVKVLYFIRHAEGHHNAAERLYGTEKWDASISMLDDYLDAALNDAGIADAQTRSIFMKAELDGGMPLDRIVVSPLTRTVQTATHYFNLTTATPSLFAVSAVEMCRETLGVHTCDKRRPTSALAHAFPYVNWSGIAHEDDPLWDALHRETDGEIELRCRRFLDEVFTTMPETHIAVVSHGGFIRACMNVLVMPSYKPRNCEVVPVVIQRRAVAVAVADEDDAFHLPAAALALLVVVLSLRCLRCNLFF